eukprot:gb/GFBE01035356.1/.p1 GENE.gb/GFBE01035356.1/~~gb/GFBE01035356.1/.p1  ORF type:complete len:124 (+),score=17.04 gb/GFBE01035356.1/:1-372(+)
MYDGSDEERCLAGSGAASANNLQVLQEVKGRAAAKVGRRFEQLNRGTTWHWSWVKLLASWNVEVIFRWSVAVGCSLEVCALQVKVAAAKHAGAIGTHDELGSFCVRDVSNGDEKRRSSCTGHE